MLGFLDILPALVLRNKVVKRKEGKERGKKGKKKKKRENKELSRSSFMWLWAGCGPGLTGPASPFLHESLTNSWACSLSSKNVFSHSSLGFYMLQRGHNLQWDQGQHPLSTCGPGWDGKCSEPGSGACSTTDEQCDPGEVTSSLQASVSSLAINKGKREELLF